jgi:hypothetical protein
MVWIAAQGCQRRRMLLLMLLFAQLLDCSRSGCYRIMQLSS